MHVDINIDIENDLEKMPMPCSPYVMTNLQVQNWV